MRRLVPLVFLIACFSPDLPSGTIPCPDQTCPDDFYCAVDGKCYQNGTSPPECGPGFERVAARCVDIDECARGTAGCDAHAACANREGGFTCRCDQGWSGDGQTCADIDECDSGTAGCDGNATCTNGPGNFACDCNTGYAGDGVSCHGDFGDVAVTGDHGCAVRRDGALFCWGSGSLGQLGLGAGVTTSAAPAPVPGSWRQVAVALGASCGIRTDGSLWCWGDGRCGQLGNGSGGGCQGEVIAREPVAVAPDARWKQVSTSPGFACAIASDGTLWCWGANADGRLGLGDGYPSPNVPAQVGSDTDWSEVRTGGAHSCGLKTGQLWCWGDNGSGQLGDGGVSSQAPSPKRIGGASSWQALAAGDSHTCAVLGDRTLYCWGADDFGQLGDDGSVSQASPSPLPGQWDTVAAGRYHTCGRRTGGGVSCWGRNRSGEIGDGSFDLRRIPTAIDGPDLVKLAAGVEVSCGVAADGRLSCWGWNGQLALGAGRGGTRLAPAPLAGRFATLAAGSSHACGIRAADAALVCWGANESGQLGIGSSGAPRDAPQTVMVGTQFQAVAVGFRTSCAVDVGGALYCWGDNGSGQVGGATGNPSEPAPVHLGEGYRAVAVGDGHACALAGDTLACWGSNSDGQLGLGALGSQPTPTLVGAGWDAIATGGFHTCGRQGGELWCWGYNGGGAVGNGDTSGADVRSPQPIGSDADWTEITAGETHSCGRRGSRLYCWGDGFYGQLGNGSSGSGATLRAPGSLGSVAWKQVTAGFLRTCAVRGDGILHCWGWNGPDGLLGLGYPDDLPVTSTPTPIGAGIDWESTVLGWDMSFGQAGGALLGWGGDDVGQLGDDATYFEVPTALD